MTCDVNFCDSFVKSPQTCQPFLEDSFSCQLPRPTGRVAPFHTAGVENADRYLSVRPVRSNDPPQGSRFTTGKWDPSRPTTTSDYNAENVLRAKSSGINASGVSWWSLTGWTPSALLFSVEQLKARESSADLTHNRPILRPWSAFWCFCPCRATSTAASLIENPPKSRQNSKKLVVFTSFTVTDPSAVDQLISMKSAAWMSCVSHVCIFHSWHNWTIL